MQTYVKDGLPANLKIMSECMVVCNDSKIIKDEKT